MNYETHIHTHRSAVTTSRPVTGLRSALQAETQSLTITQVDPVLKTY